MRNEQGARQLEKGVYIIVDGGHLKWEILQCGLKTSSKPGYGEWQTRMESVRKYIECYFGSLKHRFRVLKVPDNSRKKSTLMIWCSLSSLFKTWYWNGRLPQMSISHGSFKKIGRTYIRSQCHRWTGPSWSMRYTLYKRRIWLKKKMQLTISFGACHKFVRRTKIMRRYTIMTGTMMWVLVFHPLNYGVRIMQHLDGCTGDIQMNLEKFGLHGNKSFWSTTTPGSAQHIQIVCGYAANSLRTI